jgi:putative oxidoreductase
MSLAEMISPFIGRLALAWFFLSDAYMRALQWNSTIAWMAAKHLPAPAILLFVSLAAMILGGLSLMLGFRAKAGALVLFAFTVVTTILLHNYWVIQDAAERMADYEIFIRNIAIAGGLLLVLGVGPGRFAADNAKQRGREH